MVTRRERKNAGWRHGGFIMARARCIGMRGSLWLSMTRKWVFPHPIIQRSRAPCLCSLVGPGPLADRDRTGRVRVSSQVRSDEDVGADAPRAPTWKDTNAPAQARGYNKSSACMCAEKLRDEKVRDRHASACVRLITRNLRRVLPREHSFACIADRLDLIRRFWQK